MVMGGGAEKEIIQVVVGSPSHLLKIVSTSLFRLSWATTHKLFPPSSQITHNSDKDPPCLP